MQNARNIFQSARLLLWMTLTITGLSGCATRSGMLQASGIAAPDPAAQPREYRLNALERARQDAWLNLYDELRAMPLRENVLIGDQLTVDPRARARVLNYIWNADVLDQKYDAENELAEVTIALDLRNVRSLIESAY